MVKHYFHSDTLLTPESVNLLSYEQMVDCGKETRVGIIDGIGVKGL